MQRWGWEEMVWVRGEVATARVTLVNERDFDIQVESLKVMRPKNKAFSLLTPPRRSCAPTRPGASSPFLSP